MDSMLTMPMCWAQTAPDEFQMTLLALRRWCWGQTLSSPRPRPGSEGLATWALALLALLLVAMVAQGPVKALRQLFDVTGHVRLAGAAMARLRASARMVMILLGAAVLCWTTALLLRYNRPDGLADLTMLTRIKSPAELAAEQGTLAALTPLRDLFSLADLVALLAVGAFVAFKYSADRWGDPDAEPLGKPLPAWATVAWACSALYALYRVAATLATAGDLPMGGCLFVEPLAIPALMLVADGLLASWVLAELASAGRAAEGEPLRASAALAILPAAMLACLIVMPSRYAATASYLALGYVPDEFARAALAPMLGGWGAVVLQGAALLAAGLAGAVPWSRGGPGSALRGYGRMLRAEGGHLVAALAIGGLAVGILAGLCYLPMLALPPQPWVLPAADAYAHYASLAVGLGLLAALVELGARSATSAESAEPAAVAEAAGAAG